MMPRTPTVSLWLSTPNHLFVEIAISHGYSSFVLDVEHGIFDTDATDRLVALEQIAATAAAAGKSWWMPAWTVAERRAATALGAGQLLVAEELAFFQDGLERLTRELRDLRDDGT